MMMSSNGFSPVQKRMMDILSDGLFHSKEELHACLEDDLGPLSNIAAHLTAIRKKLAPNRGLLWYEGQYRIVALTASPYDGRT